ncbi:tetratricopeptide repeat protein [bacterium]|jgi:tetratricopeptide (TPR) repeat protein|nr:tetratricopeptide repeat protein [bacterium]
MSLLDRIFGRHENSDYAIALKFFNDGDFEESAKLFRSVLKIAEGKTGSLSAFYLRQCLMKQGRAALVQKEYAKGSIYFEEAAVRWPSFPDLRFWYGYSLSMSGDWAGGLEESSAALRYNGEYLEARLLSICALLELGQREDASVSLNDLLDSVKDKNHPASLLLKEAAPYSPENMPTNLINIITDITFDSKSGNSVELAIASCRSGSWEDGIAIMRRLCEEHPAWPDYKVKLAAALFQVGKNDEAFIEVEQALLLNPKYRTAGHLKALILADNSQFNEALKVIESEPQFTCPDKGHPGEELFCCYLAAVLYLLTGRYSEVEAKLASWQDLPSTFPMASMLIAAANDLENNTVVALDGLLELVNKWPHESNYRHALASVQLRMELLEALESNLIKWQSSEIIPDENKETALLMAGYLSLARGEVLVSKGEHTQAGPSEAWTFLYAYSASLAGNWKEVSSLLENLVTDDQSTERISSLIAKASLASGISGDYNVPVAVPETVLRDTISLMHRTGDSAEANSTLRKMQSVHPDDIRWTWLDPEYWLHPVRRWIG